KKKGIKVTGKWKTVEIDPSLFADEDFGDIVCLEELTDYKLVSSSKLGEVKEKKRKADSVSDEDSEEQAPVVSPKKKKKTKGLRSKTDTSNEPCAAEIDVSVDKEANCKDRGHVAETTSSKKDAPKKKKIAKNKASQAQEALPSVPTSKKVKNWTTEVLSASANHKADVSAWKDLFVPEPVLRALSYLGFSAPTPIQALALPSAIRDNMDVLGAAETGKNLLNWLY
ncbi:ATP-dependent RNA helicase DDX24, partial [Apaloderma vittatum]